MFAWAIDAQPLRRHLEFIPVYLHQRGEFSDGQYIHYLRQRFTGEHVREIFRHGSCAHNLGIKQLRVVAQPVTEINGFNLICAKCDGGQHLLNGPVGRFIFVPGSRFEVYRVAIL